MSDIKSKEARSRNMAAIKGKDTSPETYLRKCLFSKGYRYRKNSPRLIGHPDIWMAKYKTAVFVHGCFWHRHQGCKYAYTPKSNVEFWEKKFNDNVIRDRNVKSALMGDGIKCLIVWECTIKNMKRSKEFEGITLDKISQFLHSSTLYLEI